MATKIERPTCEECAGEGGGDRVRVEGAALEAWECPRCEGSGMEPDDGSVLAALSFAEEYATPYCFQNTSHRAHCNEQARLWITEARERLAKEPTEDAA